MVVPDILLDLGWQQSQPLRVAGRPQRPGAVAAPHVGREERRDVPPVEHGVEPAEQTALLDQSGLFFRMLSSRSPAVRAAFRTPPNPGCSFAGISRSKLFSRH